MSDANAMRPNAGLPGSGLSATGRSLASPQSEQGRIWTSFAEARLASEFCTHWLTLQCGELPGAMSGLLLLEDEPNTYTPAAIWPDETIDVSALGPAAERALRERRGVVERATTGEVRVAYPVEIRGRMWGVVAVEIEGRPDAEIVRSLRALHWGAGWIETLFYRRSADQDQRGTQQTQDALALAEAATGRRGVAAAAMALSNALAGRVACRRVAVGIARDGHVRVLGLSHAAIVERHSRLSASLAAAMEEALDQGATISYPALPAHGRRIAIAHRDHAKLAGLSAIVSIVITAESRPAGVITLERDSGEAVTADDIAACERAAALLGSVMLLQRDYDRPLAGRIPRAAASASHMLLGRRHPTVKLGVLVAIGAVAALALIPAAYRITGKSVLEGVVQRVAVAPFDGFVATAPRRAGDVVEAGEVLATLDTRELSLEALRYESQRDQALLRQQEAEGKHDRAEAGVQAATAAEAEAQRALVADKLARAHLTAPFRGLVISGDLSQSLGSPVERGKTLFEIAPLDSYRVNIQVEEREIARIHPGQRGRMVLTGLSAEPFDLTVDKVVPVATSAEGRNTFRVEALLDASDPRLRPGMEGVGKIDAGQASLLWIWTHPIIDWARLMLWKWMP